MKRKSHIHLGGLLADRYLYHRGRVARGAFVLGCIEPDWNPATYLKGSLRYAKLRGHNFPTAQGCIRRLCERLERHNRFGLLALYRMGKLTHYIADAFTHPHNGYFAGNLEEHLAYEAELQAYFLQEKSLPQPELEQSGSIYQLILQAHERYRVLPACKQNDASYAHAVASAVVAALYEGAPEPALA